MEQVEIIESAEYTGDWISEELDGISLGDKRLDWRVRDSGKKLAARPSVSINQACDDWADTKATYRLFANQKTTAAKVLSPHQKRTQARMGQYERCLVLQDTTYLDYSHHPSKQGMGPTGTTQQGLRGIVDPPPDVEPLEWLLLTTVPVCTFDHAVERITWYCHRWQIEILGMVQSGPKSSLQIECVNGAQFR